MIECCGIALYSLYIDEWDGFNRRHIEPRITTAKLRHIFESYLKCMQHRFHILANMCYTKCDHRDSFDIFHTSIKANNIPYTRHHLRDTNFAGEQKKKKSDDNCDGIHWSTNKTVVYLQNSQPSSVVTYWMWVGKKSNRSLMVRMSAPRSPNDKLSHIHIPFRNIIFTLEGWMQLYTFMEFGMVNICVPLLLCGLRDTQWIR